MPSIEYSPTGRAKCRGCYQKIPTGCVRVGVKSKSPYRRGDFITEYYHAACYKGRKDFSRFFGWSALHQDDKNLFGPAVTHCTPIANLRSGGGSWKIRAVVLSKSAVRTWNNAKGSGKLFHVELMDESGVDIKAIFFTEAAVNKFYDLLQVNTTYILADGTLKMANPKYNKCQSKLEIVYTESSRIEVSPQPVQLPLRLVKISPVAEKELGAAIDLVAYVKQVEEPVEFATQNTESSNVKLRVWLVDDTACLIAWTLWGDAAEPPSTGTVVHIAKTRLSDHGGRSLSGALHWSTVGNDDPSALAIVKWLATMDPADLDALPSLTELPKKAPGATTNESTTKEETTTIVTEESSAKSLAAGSLVSPPPKMGPSGNGEPTGVAHKTPADALPELPTASSAKAPPTATVSSTTTKDEATTSVAEASSSTPKVLGAAALVSPPPFEMMDPNGGGGGESASPEASGDLKRKFQAASSSVTPTVKQPKTTEEEDASGSSTSSSSLEQAA